MRDWIIAMLKRRLGKTSLEVTVLGYGAMELRNEEAPTDEQATRLLNAVLDAGINIIDTSPDYGLSEQRIGEAIAHRRDEYFLATKCGCNVPRADDEDAPRHVWTRSQLLHNIELSLQRMKTDHVDIWQLHNAGTDDVHEGELLEVMDQVKQQGKVRHVSISSTLPHISTFIDQGGFESYQIAYSALQRGEENSITAAAESGAGTIIRGGVAKGEPDDGLRSNDAWRIWDKADLDELRGDGESRTAFLLRFTITHPHMHTTIVGTKNPAHLAENLRALDAGPLPSDVYEQAKWRLDEAGQRPAGA